MCDIVARGKVRYITAAGHVVQMNSAHSKDAVKRGEKALTQKQTKKRGKAK